MEPPPSSSKRQRVEDDCKKQQIIQRILVATTSELKIEAVKLAFEMSFEEKQIIFHCEGISAPSSINAQPFGMNETLQGALNRLEYAINSENYESYDYIVSIENGIFEVNQGQQFFDIGWIVLQRRSDGKRVFSTTPSIEFSSEVVEQAKQKGFSTTTVGDILSETYEGNCNTKDPHSFLTHSKFSRVDLLELGVKAALAQL
mmetsp:Transcript_18243/g.24038  ORF Transcript_18243/g.24038 Transcript_18243/m.24038 type:complete len:202 (-) Transcript_18243:75-680(-)